MNEALKECNKGYLIKQLEYSYKEIERLNDLLEGEHKVNQMYLNNIIKAIDFIEEHNIIGTNKEYLPSGIEKCYSLELMEILKGKDKK